MKKTLLVIFALACITISNANPINPPPPIIGLSEFTFDSNGKWIIELSIFSDYDYYYAPIDSILITSSTGKSKLKNFKSVGTNRLMMIRNDSLLSNLNINPTGDSIQVKYYTQYTSNRFYLSSPIVFGNFKNAKLFAPKIGESIAACGNYSLCKTPTLGTANDSTGMCGTIKGRIYNSNNQLLLNSTLKLNNENIFYFTPKSDGTYSARILSNNNQITQLIYYEGLNRFIVDIVPIDVSIKPDTVVTADIHILKITAIKEIKSDPVTVFQIFPNPIKDLSFNYQVSIPVKSSNSYLELISINGQKIARYPVSDDKGKINLPATVTNGTYTVRLFVNNKNYGTSKILIAR
jgi:hypothetical protein